MAATASPSAGPLRLTPCRRSALLFGVPVCLALVGMTGLGLVGDFAEGSYPVSYAAPAATRALTLDVPGQLTIRQTAAGRVTLAGTAHYAFIRPAPVGQSAGDRTTIGYDCPIPINNCELDGTVTVPASVTTLTAHSGSGGFALTGTTGPVTLSTGDGNLSVGQASGPLALDTDSGDIRVSAITSATLSASTGDGDIGITGAAAKTITADTDSGSITGSGIAAATVTASSGDGDIVIAFTGAPPRDVSVDTDSGNITLLLPPSATRYHVTADTDSGTVSDTLPRDASSANVITASSGSGNVTIAERAP